MTLNVSSWFITQLKAKTSFPKRVFTIGGSDYSDSVLRWPKIVYRADTINLGTVSLSLSNRNRDIKFFVDCSHFMTTSCELALVFTHPESGDEKASLYWGEPDSVVFTDKGMVARLKMQGKTKRLTDTTLGTDTNSGAVNFTNSPYYPSDLAWTIVTCYGGMSSIQNSSNPDIDYLKWKAWRDIDEIRAVEMKAYIKGEKIFQVLNTLSYMNSMVILFRNDMLDFTPIIDAFDSADHDFTPDEIIDLKLRIDQTDILNEFFVEVNYNQGSGNFQGYYTHIDSRSQKSFGKKSNRFGSRSVWFNTINDARYFAEDRVRFHNSPSPKVSLNTTLAGGGHLTVGDIVTISDSIFQLEEKSFRVMEMAMDLGQGTIDFNLEQANQRPWHFQTTVSTDNLLVRTITPLSEGRYLAIDESISAKKVHRKESDGLFKPLDTFAMALFAINDNEIIFGGPPSSGSPNSVLQRSSDSGSSCVTVSSLTHFTNEVHDFFEVKSGTLIVSTSSGGIWRSTNVGSSWYLTSTISGAYHIHKFFQPYSGTIWGGTGYDNLSFCNGVHIWESINSGITWNPKHTVIASGDYQIQGFFGISDTEFLLATYGSGIIQRNIYRSLYTSPDSISWVKILTDTTFTEILRTSSGHLLFGFYEELTQDGGTTYRSLDAGSSWITDAYISKQGNIKLLDNGDGTFDAFTSRIKVGVRTDQHRNFDPNRND